MPKRKYTNWSVHNYCSVLLIIIVLCNIIYTEQHISMTEEALFSNPDPLPCPPLHNNNHHSSTSPVHYQPLNTATTDYISVYVTPNSAWRRGTPLVEVEGKMYSIVDPTILRKDEHIYATPQT